MGPFHVTKAMVAALGDEPLRELLQRLLEAEARKRGLPGSSVFVGGGQTAPDGGVDASIEWHGDPKPSGWLERRSIYFQCKAQTMRPKALTREMRPGGMPRPIFSELSAKAGAYVVFSTDDPSKSAMDDRLTAMKTALIGVDGAEDVALSFLGSDQIARWVADHHGVAIWVLERSGRSLGGWSAFDAWSSGRKGLYLRDTEVRVAIDGREDTVDRAIADMRAALAKPGGVVRLVGISGMGKTRLAEALFDDAVGVDALPKTWAVYGDAGVELPTGAALVTEQIALAGVEATIIVDNCRLRTHEHLARLVNKPGSRASLLTIDYDVGEDKPSGLLVQLGANSDVLIARLIQQEHPRLSRAERDHVARFAGGNARIAMKIAAVGGSGVDLSRLNDNELLDRLFQVGPQDDNPALRKIAAVASLVWAFYVEDADGFTAEDRALAELAETSLDDFAYGIGTLLEWGVVQQRGPQKSVMPPPLANMLAASFIRRSRTERLVEAISAGGPRLIRSFARRLGQLHGQPAATRIVERLVGPKGILGEPASLDEMGRKAFTDAAPAAPIAVLDALERSLAGPLGHDLVHPKAVGRQTYGRLLAKLAHDPELFPRALSLMAEFAINDDPTGRENLVRPLLLDLFLPVLSLTLAPQETRLEAAELLLTDASAWKRSLGVDAVGRMLKVTNFASSLDLAFGSRTRTTEWRPPNGYETWFQVAVATLAKVAHAGGPEAEQARAGVADSARGLVHAGFAMIAVDALRSVRPASFWYHGWVSTVNALRFARRPEDQTSEDEQRSVVSVEELASLYEIERDLRPANLDSCIEAFVFGNLFGLYRTGPGRSRPRKVALLARATGRAWARIGRDPAEIMPRAASPDGPNAVTAFVEGLCEGGMDHDVLWRVARKALAELPPATRRVDVLSGILNASARTAGNWTNERLDEVANDPEYALVLTTLSAAMPIDGRALARFLTALEKGHLRAEDLVGLEYYGLLASVAEEDLASFLRTVVSHDGGTRTAMHIMRMRFLATAGHDLEPRSELLTFAEELLTNTRLYRDELGGNDHSAAEIAEVVLRQPGAEVVARSIVSAIRAADRGSRSFEREFHYLTKLLMQLNPEAILDATVGDEDDEEEQFLERLFGGWARDDDDAELSDDINVERLLAWVQIDPVPRAPKLAAAVPYVRRTEDDRLGWTPLAWGLIAITPDPLPVLQAFEDRFQAGSAVGSWARRLVGRRALIAELLTLPNDEIRNWATAAGKRLENSILAWNGRDRRDDSRFE